MRRTIRIGLTAVLLATAALTRAANAQATPDAAPAPAQVVCRAEPDGRAPASAGGGQARATALPRFGATGGIGGTGAAPLPPLAGPSGGIGGTGGQSLLADRGIGGTGAPERTADRGIGGTGIVGAITGFASVCVNGIEVAFGAADHVTVDGAAVPASALRVGQVAMIEASSTDAGLDARSISVRHEVSGPVEAVLADGKVLVVARQRVLIRPRTILGGNAPRVGDWVAVSGFRTPMGAVFATRIDPRAPGTVTVTGLLRRMLLGVHINRLEIRLPAGTPPPPPPRRVTVTGHYAGGVLVAESVTDARFLRSPGIRRFLVQAYVARLRNRLQLGDGLEVDVDKGFGAAPVSADIAVIELEANDAGKLVAVGRRDVDSLNHGATTIQAAPAAPHAASSTTPAKEKEADKAKDAGKGAKK